MAEPISQIQFRQSSEFSPEACRLCPRNCGIDRKKSTGFCGADAEIKVARAALHHWEEPCISGTRGSGTVFFSHCTLRCRFCQNEAISSGGVGKVISAEQLSRIFLNLQAMGAHNLNLVTPTHYTEGILDALDRISDRLNIPVAFNCGGYETLETVRRYQSRVRIWMPDLKYFSSELSKRYSGASDYFEKASAAICQMVEQAGPPVFDEDGLLRSGVLIRHLVLPGCRKDSLTLLDWLKKALPKESFLLSLMSQFTPTPACTSLPELNRRLTTYEYQTVARKALELGFQGYFQERDSAQPDYTPAFDLTGVE